MCILFGYVSHNPAESGYQLILASNRDEEFTRPTRPAAWWPQHPDCISGLDAVPGKEGGTWMGLSTHGRVGVLLNILENNQSSNNPKRGRGHLVSNYLLSPENTEDYVYQLEDVKDQYYAFNLILLDHERTEPDDLKWHCTYVSNRDSTQRNMTEEIFGVGNSAMADEWLKVTHGKEKFASIIEHSQSIPRLTYNLLHMLKDETKYWPDARIEKQGAGTKMTPDILHHISSVYFNGTQASFGTRTHTVLIVDAHGRGTYTESTMIEPIDPTRPRWHTSSFTFNTETIEQ